MSWHNDQQQSAASMPAFPGDLSPLRSKDETRRPEQILLWGFAVPLVLIMLTIFVPCLGVAGTLAVLIGLVTGRHRRRRMRLQAQERGWQFQSRVNHHAFAGPADSPVPWLLGITRLLQSGPDADLPRRTVWCSSVGLPAGMVVLQQRIAPATPRQPLTWLRQRGRQLMAGTTSRYDTFPPMVLGSAAFQAAFVVRTTPDAAGPDGARRLLQAGEAALLAWVAHEQAGISVVVTPVGLVVELDRATLDWATLERLVALGTTLAQALLDDAPEDAA